MTKLRDERATPSLLDVPEVRTARVARVALLRPIDKTYNYIIPDELADSIQPGRRVTVPFGRNDKPSQAFCLSVSDEPWESTLKPVLDLVDDEPLLNEKMLELGRWMSRYYAAHLGRTLDLMVPAATKRRAGRRKVKYAVLTNLPGRKEEQEKADQKLTKKQNDVLNVLNNANGRLATADLCRAAACTDAVLKTLEKKGGLTFETRLETVDPVEPDVQRVEPKFELNTDQKAAIDQITRVVTNRAFSVQVLYGVTGSGKTEIYVHAIRRALAEGRQAIMLVPEIALTTQTIRRLQERFERVATIHSGLTDVQRSRTWSAVASGVIPVVIGTRSAVFAPCPNLGLIIVDEEAEPSYKSQAAPRYHTRDVAVKRGHLENIPVVLGSATPSLETWNNLQNRKHYHLIRLPRRVRDLPMPMVHLVDMRMEHKARRGVHLLSRAMESHLEEVLQRDEQAVLLLNRRGFASYLHCPRCQTVVVCPHCSVHMVFHATTELAHCHYCHAKLAVPNRCKSSGCGGTLVRFGMGTQRVEAELREKFPDAKLRRIDADTMNSASDYADLLGAFERKEFDFLIGTQMIAKGLDFPFVSFVGVISADTALALDDFRSEERTFQLVLQVAGRSGRGETSGHVVVQTFASDTAPIRHAVEGDYEGFAKLELNRRHESRLPPYTRMVRIVLADGRMSKLRTAAESLVDKMQTLLSKRGLPARILGPYPAAIPRLRDRYRDEILLIFDTGTTLIGAMDLFKDEGTLRVGVKSLIVDVDPVSLQ
ncbi:MAG: primosomal protein N' [Phycisphaerales bacterium]|nr:primosomal protein N' [Phycisphaerales bacterium]